MEDLDGFEQYEQFHWGNKPAKVRQLWIPHVDPDEAGDLVWIGKLRCLWTNDRRRIILVKPFPDLCFGSKDHRLYFTGLAVKRASKDKLFGKPGTRYTIARIDYSSPKGQEDRRRTIYYYHHHAKPFPELVVMQDGWPVYSGGSYDVAPEGIVD